MVISFAGQTGLLEQKVKQTGQLAHAGQTG
jgi:hypothetical protein